MGKIKNFVTGLFSKKKAGDEEKQDSLSAALFGSIFCRKFRCNVVHFFKELLVRLALYKHDLLELTRPFVLETGNSLAGADARMQDGLQIFSVIRFLFNLLLPTKHHLPPVQRFPRR